MNQFPKMGSVPSLRGQGGCYAGRRGLPSEWVARMYEDYKRLRSLEKVGRLHDRTRQSIYGLFKTHGFKLNAKTFKTAIVYKGRKYTIGKNDYYRDTVIRSSRYHDGETLLHRRVWIDAHGPIPPGNKIGFKDGNRHNCAIENLFMMTHDEQQQQRGSGRNQFTTTAKDRLNRLLGGASASAALKARAA